MRIGIVCYPTYGGSGVVAAELGRGLARRGHQIHFIASDRPFRLLDTFSENIFCHEVPTIDYPLFGESLYTLSLAVKIAEVARDKNLDLVHVHYAVPHAISASLAKDMLAAEGIRIPLVTTLHGTDITLVGRSPAFAPAVRLGIERSDATVCVSRWLRDETLHSLQTTGEIRVIYNPVDGQVFRPNHNARFRECFAAGTEGVLMHISNFRPVKRVADVVEVFARVVKETSAKLVMIGDGPECEKAIQRARDLKVIEDCWFLGKQAHVENLLPLADLFLFPSDGESFGLAAAEAMACETPVIAANPGGIGEVISHGKTGILAPVGDVETMAREAIGLLRDPERRHAMGAAARTDILERFASDKIVGQYEDLYRSVLDGAASVN